MQILDTMHELGFTQDSCTMHELGTTQKSGTIQESGTMQGLAWSHLP